MRVSSLVLYAVDVSRTAEFYRRCLGIEFTEVGRGRVTAQVDGVRLAVVPMTASGATAQTGDPGTAMVGFDVPDISDAVEQAGEAGGAVLRQPERLDWGIRGVVSDPDGRVVEFVQR